MKNFWMVFSTVAVTLAGFTLVTFSIFTTRTGMTEGDQVCRRHGLKEASSADSWTFVFFAFFMFLIPIIVGLLILSPPDRVPSPDFIRYVAIGVTVLLIWFLIYALWKQCQYLWRVTKHNVDVESWKRELNTTDPHTVESESKGQCRPVEQHCPQPGKGPITSDSASIKEEIILILTTLCLAVLLILIVATVTNISVACVLALSIMGIAKRIVLTVAPDLVGPDSPFRDLSAEYINFGLMVLLLLVSFLLLLVDLGCVLIELGNRDLWPRSLVPPAVLPSLLGVSLTLLVGITLTYFHYFLFQPARLLFEISDSAKRSLKMTIDHIEKKCEELENLRKQLSDQLKIPHKKLIATVMAKKHLSETAAQTFIEEQRQSLQHELQDLPLRPNEFVLETKPKHVRRLKFGLRSETKAPRFVTYRWINETTNETKFYLEGLKGFEVRLNNFKKGLETLPAVVNVHNLAEE